MQKNRLAISSLTWKSQPLVTAVEKAAHSGFAWVDLGILSWSQFGPLDLIDSFDQHILPVKAALDKNGVRVSSLNAGIENSPSDPDGLLQAKALCRAARLLDAAAGVTLSPPASGQSIQDAAKALMPRVSLFADEGVQLMVETHMHSLTESLPDTIMLLKAVPGLQITLDASHYLVQGYQPDEITALLSRTGHAHIRACGRAGWDTIEVEPEQSTPLLFEWLRTMEQGGYNALYGFEMIEGFHGIPDAEASTMRLLQKVITI